LFVAADGGVVKQGLGDRVEAVEQAMAVSFRYLEREASGLGRHV
jgi:hypothetical protein